jgi:hypothetical protein
MRSSVGLDYREPSSQCNALHQFIAQSAKHPQWFGADSRCAMDSRFRVGASMEWLCEMVFALARFVNLPPCKTNKG